MGGDGVGLQQSTKAPKHLRTDVIRVKAWLMDRKDGFSTEQFSVSAYVGSSKNLKDLKDLPCRERVEYRGTSLVRNTHPPKTTLGP